MIVPIWTSPHHLVLNVWGSRNRPAGRQNLDGLEEAGLEEAGLEEAGLEEAGLEEAGQEEAGLAVAGTDNR